MSDDYKRLPRFFCEELGITCYGEENEKLRLDLEQANKSVQVLAEAFDEVCHDIRNHAPKYVHPLEFELANKYKDSKYD